MFNLEELKVIIVMMKRASCSGEEATAVAITLDKIVKAAVQLEKDAQQIPKVEIEDGDNA